MSEENQIHLDVVPMPEGIVWQILEGKRRIGHGTEKAGDWEAVRRVEVLTGLARVVVRGAYVNDAARARATLWGWEVRS